MSIFQHIPHVQRLPHPSLGITPDPLVPTYDPPVISLTFHDWLIMIRSERHLRNIYHIFEYSSSNRFLGFGRGGKKVFKEIARTLRSFHLADSFCGNIETQFRITHPGLTVICPFIPIHTTNPVHLVNGVRHDLHCFRSLVYRILDGYVDFSYLPFEFGLFFSDLYSDGAFHIREASFLQLNHPLFFDSDDRRRFCEAVFEFRKSDPGRFDVLLNFETNPALYAVEYWDQNLSKSSAFYKILKYADSRCSVQRSVVNYNSIPMFLRNAHHHFSDHDKINPPDFCSSMLNIVLPGICSKILDAVLRNVVSFDRVSFSMDKFLEILDSDAYGFSVEPYRFV